MLTDTESMPHEASENSSYKQWAGQVILAGFSGKRPGKILLNLIQQDALAGVILFSRNLETLQQTHSLLSSLQQLDPNPHPLLTAVDQEGGRVQRLGPPVIQLPPAATLAKLSAEEITQAALLLGQQLRSIGFNLDFAPILDIHTHDQNPVIGDRSFGNTAEQVVEKAGAFAEGLSRGGILCCGKHFPGHGDTTEDSHFALPVITHPIERLMAVELAPFFALAKRLPAIMTAHIVCSVLDSQKPCTLSPNALQRLLREEIGFSGTIISDDLEMKAIADHHSIETASCDAIAAGCDLLLICKDESLVTRAISALAERCLQDSAFAARLQQAAKSVQTLREKAGTLPPPPTWDLKTVTAQQKAMESAWACGV